MIDKKLSLKQYVDIFNFLSKIIYYSCSEDTSSLSLRRLKCNELIPKYDVLDEAKEIIESMYKGSKVKFINLYTLRVDETLTISVIDCQMKYKDKEDYDYLRPISFANRMEFSDDNTHIFLFIDQDLYKGIDYESTKTKKGADSTNNDYFVMILRAILFQFNFFSEIDSYTYILANLLYMDGNTATDKINECVDKILKEATSNEDYIRIDYIDSFREILHQYKKPKYDIRSGDLPDYYK